MSTGSACSSKTLEPSHTLIATGLLHEEAHGWLELTSGRWTTDDEVDKVLEVLPGIVQRLRSLSPCIKKILVEMKRNEINRIHRKSIRSLQESRNVGTLEGPDVASGRVGNPICGDLMEIYIKVIDDKIDDIKFKTFGCGSAVATSSMITEMVKG